MIQSELTERASCGDHDAQVEIANCVAQSGISGDLPLDQALTLALVWSGMAATSGRAAHLLAYAGILMAQASQAPEDQISSGEFDEDFATVLAIVEAVAESGHRRAAAVGFALASKVSPAVIARAREIKPSVHAEPLSETELSEDAVGLDALVAALGINTTGSC